MIMTLQNAIAGLPQSMAAGAASLSDSSMNSAAILLVLVVEAGRSVAVLDVPRRRRPRGGPP